MPSLGGAPLSNESGKVRLAYPQCVMGATLVLEALQHCVSSPGVETFAFIGA